MVSLDSRTGRQSQRYNRGSRQVVGCIPYRYNKAIQSSSNLVEELEVLVISSQKCEALMFPKGGWELDESMDEAALRETREEAGVVGEIELRLSQWSSRKRLSNDISQEGAEALKLGRWFYFGKRNGISHEGRMFPLFVEEELDHWPEGNARQRRWMKVSEAREASMPSWMKAALEELVKRLVNLQQQEEIRDAIASSI